MIDKQSVRILCFGGTDRITEEAKFNVVQKCIYVEPGASKEIQNAQTGYRVVITETVPERAAEAVVKQLSVWHATQSDHDILTADGTTDDQREWFRSFTAELPKAQRAYQAILFTDYVHARLFQKNEVINTARMDEYGNPEALRDAYKGKSVICVAAGPSLDESLEGLIKAQEQGIPIFCVDTVVPVLLDAGIVPEVCGCIDPIHAKIDRLTGLDSRSILLTAQHTCPKIVRESHANVFMTGARNPTGTWAASIHGKRIDFDNVITVSHLIFSVAAITGASRIVLVGYDFSFIEDDSGGVVSHGTGCATWRATKAGGFYAEGNHGKEVFTQGNLFAFGQRLELMIDELNGSIEITNTSTRGLRVRGTVVSPLDETII